MIGILFSVIRIDVVLELISFAICAFISLSFLRAHLNLGSRVFAMLSAGFGLMGGAMLVRALIVGASLFGFFGRDLSRTLMPYLFQVELLYSFVRLTAYLLFVLAYVLYQAPRASAELAVVPPPVLLIYNPAFELMSVVLLAYVVAASTGNWRRTNSRGSGSVALGFWALLASHLLFALTPLNFILYFAGHAVQLLSLLLILFGALEAMRG
ncbi:MAG: hypothetical protein QXO17_05695 [Nitrososphaerota archaeon]